MTQTPDRRPGPAGEAGSTSSSGTEPGGGEPKLVVLVDDVRSFRDDRACLVARTAADAIGVLRAHRGGRIDELWLDYDLGRYPDGSDHTTMPVVAELVAAAEAGARYDIGRIFTHTVNPVGGVRMRAALTAAGYRAVGHYTKIWRW